MGGFFGVAAKEDCVFDLFFGTDYHSHLGTRRAGLAVYDLKKGFDRAIHNIENAPFRTKFDKDVSEMKGPKEFNERTKNDVGLIIPVVITVYADRSFTFVTKTPPAAVLIKKACGIETASGVPNKNKVAKITRDQVKKIAETKMPDLNAASVEAAMSMVAGTARSMGIEVVD